MISSYLRKYVKFFILAVIVVVLLTIFLSKFRVDTTYKKKLVNSTSLISSQTSSDNAPSEQNSLQEKQDLEKYLTVEAALLGLSNNMSLYVKNHKQNYEIAIDPDRSWIPASTIKAFVVLEAFRQRNNRTINFDERVFIKKQNVVPTELESYDFPVLQEGVRISIRELITTMITQSDNTAYNTLLDILDRRNINATLKRYGLIDTVVGEKINLDDSQYQQDLQVPGRQTNKTTAKNLAMLFNLLYDKKIPDSEEILSVFKSQKVNYMIPKLLPENTIVAHKTGEWSPYYHDGGIVYKASDPFTLVIFTDHDSPNDLAELAKAAYFKNGNLTNMLFSPKITTRSKPKIIKYLTQEISQTKVLAAKTKKHFTRITAADLGITTQDLSIGKEDIRDIQDAKVTPGNDLYPLKRFVELLEVLRASNDDEKVQIYATLATNRISEIKTVLKSNDVASLPYLLTEFNNNLKKIIQIIKTTDVPDLEIIYVKQLNEQLFAIVDDNIKYVSEEKTAKFTNDFYDFYQKNQKEVESIVVNADIENPFIYEPIIGTIKRINNNVLTLTLENKSDKKVKLFDTTQIRGFHQTTIETIETLQKGSRIAVVGQYASNNEIIPIFILSDLPLNFPKKIEGVVTEINTNENTIKVVDDTGTAYSVIITDNTAFTARHTDVTIDGIKAGSDVMVFGEYNKDTHQTEATTVTVVTNSSGANTRTKILSQ